MLTPTPVLAAFRRGARADRIESQSRAQTPAGRIHLCRSGRSGAVARRSRRMSGSRTRDAAQAREAADVPPGTDAFLVEADVVALIRGARGLPARVSYLVDLPNDARGRPRASSQQQRISDARRAGRRAGRASCGWSRPTRRSPSTPATAERLRAILREAARAGAPPRITGIGRAFHVPGSLPGESETQIFLQTADERADLADRAAPAGRAAALGGRAGRDRRRCRRRARAATPCSGTASPAPCPRACRGRA